ncbi:MAG: T9SS type A sorting domain-containing protein, partial [Bacteroidia bacterium]|nr:T9SS type A sorting domain-containing protein [Bacteroidia bacterium]
LTSGGNVTPNKVSAIRTYFNFMLLAGKARQLNVTASLPPDTLSSGASYPVSASVTTGTPAYAFEWTHQNPGSGFDNPNDSATVYHAPSTTADTFDVIRIKVTDLCGRVNFISKRIYILGVPVPLPVSLVSFTASIVPQGVLLNWSTASEINNNYFTLERSSEIMNFESLCIHDGAGNSNHLINYSWVDLNPLDGFNYYRLAQTDFDGTCTTFGPICIRTEESSSALSIRNIYPNPFINSFSVSYHSANRSATLMEIYTRRGKAIYSEIMNSVQGTNYFQFGDGKLMEQGIYLITISQGREKRVTRMLIKK